MKHLWTRACLAAVSLGLAATGPLGCKSEPSASEKPAAAASSDAGSSLPPGHPPLGAPAPEALPPGHPPLAGAAGAAATVPSGPSVSGSVSPVESLASRAAGAKALYVIARKAGTREIVAVSRIDAPAFPAAFQVSGADGMGEHGTPLEGRLDLTARLSRSGDAIPAAGDLEGHAKGVQAGATGVTIVLDGVRQ